MISVNLLSAETVLSQRCSRRIRTWTATALIAAILAAVPVSLDIVNSARAAVFEGRTKPLLQESNASQAKLSTLTNQCSELATQISRADSLRRKRCWSGLLQLIGTQMPAEVWLTDIATIQAESQTTYPDQTTDDKNKASQPVMLDGPQGIRLTGYSIEHEQLYEFMSSLKAMTQFGNVELEQTGTEPVLQGTAVRFVLRCDW